MTPKATGKTMSEQNARPFMFLSGPATEVTRVVFATVYCHEDMDSKKGTLTLKECYDERRKNTPERIPKNKTSIEKYFTYIDTDTPGSKILEKKLDITFYCSAILDFCQFKGGEVPLPQDALVSLKELRNKRNDVMHCTAVVDINEIESLCIKLLDAVEQKLGGMFIAEARPEINLLIDKIKNEKIDYDQYVLDREKHRQRLRNEFMKGSQKDFEDMKFVFAVSPFTIFLMENDVISESNDPIDKLFTPPVILTYCGKKIDFPDILPPKEEGKPVAVVLSGEGGSGKSTLCHVIFEQWRKKAFELHEIKGLCAVDLILHIKLKFTRQSTLFDFLRKEYLVDQMRHVKKEALASLLNSLEILCLIDGYDEKNDNADELICDIQSCLPQSRVIITSRPEFEEDCRKAFLRKKTVVWKLEGFSNIERGKFSTIVIPLMKKDCPNPTILVDRFASYLESRVSTFASSLKLPLTVALLICLWLKNLEKPDEIEAIKTATQLQRHVFEMLKEMLTKNNSDYEQVVRVLHKIAFDNLNVNQNLLTKQNEILIKLQSFSTNLEKILQTFVMCDTKYSTDYQPTHSYSFVSRPQMEFFAAHYVSHDLQNSLTKDRSLSTYFECSNARRYKGMLPYLAGCLAQTGQLSKHSKDLVKLCRNAKILLDDFNFWFSLLHETLKSDATSHQMMHDETLKKEIISHLPETSWTLQPDVAIAGLKLLTYNPKIQSLELSLDLSLTTAKELEETLKHLRDERSKYHSESKTDLILHVVNRCCTSSHIKSFAEWCTLIEFAGCIGVDEVKHLKLCKTVNATVQDVRAFNGLGKKLAQMENLGKLTMSIGFPKNHLETTSVRPEIIIIDRKNIEIDLSFLRLIDEDTTKTIQFVRAVYPRPQGFNRIRFRGNLSFNDGVKIMTDLQDCVIGKVYVRSRQFLTEDQEAELKELIPKATDGRKKSSFILVWNDDEFYSQLDDEAP